MSPLRGRGSILVADDEQGFRDLYVYVLTPLGYEVVAVADGLAAVEAIERRAFDLVVLDVHMPRMGGPEALARIRALRPGQAVIVLSSSSDSTHSFEQEATRLRALTCLFKPVDFEELIAVIDAAIDGRRARAGGS